MQIKIFTTMNENVDCRMVAKNLENEVNEYLNKHKINPIKIEHANDKYGHIKQIMIVF